MGILAVLPVVAVVCFVVLSFFASWVRILSEYERGILFRLGRVIPEPVGPGFVLLIFPPMVDRMVKIDLRTVTLDVPPQDVITKDNVSVKVNAVVYYRVVDPVKAVLEIENYNFATTQMAQTTLRSILGQCELDELLADREKISNQIQDILDEQTDAWGIKVSNVEMKHVDLPHDMQRAMARQAEAERERRAKIISAAGEAQAAEKLVEAASLMGSHPMAMQMRYLQTMVEIGAENSSTLFFPVPIDMLSPFIDKKNN